MRLRRDRGYSGEKMKTPKNPSRHWLEKEIMEYAASIPAGSMILDAGAGSCIYKANFAHCKYESADFAQMSLKYDGLTYVCDLMNIPVEDCRYDCILFSQVMEHLPEPELVLRELRRVLKPGGRIFCGAPLMYPEHGAPHDYYRYTQYGLRHLFSKAGFVIEDIHRMEGFYQTSAWFLDYISRNLLTRHRIAKKIFAYYAGVFRKLEMKNKITDAGDPINYIVMATRSV